MENGKVLHQIVSIWSPAQLPTSTFPTIAARHLTSVLPDSLAFCAPFHAKIYPMLPGQAVQLSQSTFSRIENKSGESFPSNWELPTSTFPTIAASHPTSVLPDLVAFSALHFMQDIQDLSQRLPSSVFCICVLTYIEIQNAYHLSWGINYWFILPGQAVQISWSYVNTKST